MKKTLSLLLALLLALGLLAGCSNTDTQETEEAETETQEAVEETEAAETAEAADEDGETEIIGTITVGASPTPHAEILEAAREELLALGYELEIKEFDDYVLPNDSLANGELDANYFQHEPYLIDYNENNGTDLAAAAYIHYEPFGLYTGQVSSIEELSEGDKIAVPNDGSNEGRALKLLEQEGLITLSEDADFTATVQDIVDNPLGLEIVEVEASQIPSYLPDVAMACINGNYALGAGLNVDTDAIAKEEKDSEAATTYANIIAVQAGNEDREDILALIQALNSDSVKAFIEEKYEGSVLTLS